MKKQKNRYACYRRKNKSLKYRSEMIPPKAFRQGLNRRLRAQNKRVLRALSFEKEEPRFYLFKKTYGFTTFEKTG